MKSSGTRREYLARFLLVAGSMIASLVFLEVALNVLEEDFERFYVWEPGPIRLVFADSISPQRFALALTPALDSLFTRTFVYRT